MATTVKCRQLMIYQCCLCVIIIFSIFCYSLTEKRLHEGIEYSEYVIKRGSIHNIQNEVLQSNIKLERVPNDSIKIFFIHIPRTTGDSLRTDLFGKDKPWLIDYSGWHSAKMPFDLKKMGGSAENVYNEWRNESVKIIKGHFGISDILQSKLKTKIFTILRYPIERVLSLYKFVTLNGCNRLLYERLFHFSFCPNLTQFLQLTNDKNGKMRQLTSNYMTWQIGSNVLNRNEWEFENESANQKQFELAKEHLLFDIDFIGFYEDMWNDFEQIHSKILPNIKGTTLSRLIFNVGTFVSLPRMKTKKYSRQIGKRELKMIEERNVYDMKLYEWAKKQSNKSFELYASYKQYALSWINNLHF